MPRRFSAICPSPNGRYAVLVRREESSPWVQIDSCVTKEVAEDLVDNIYCFEDDREMRKELIAEVYFIREKWAVAEQPITFPPSELPQ